MQTFYEVPVTILYDEDELCVYVKVYAASPEEAAEKAKDMVETGMSVEVDNDYIVKI